MCNFAPSFKKHNQKSLMLNSKSFFDMTKSFNVSDEVRNIIRKFNQAFNANRGILTRMAQPINTLAVSLYALKQDARKDVLGMLHDYNLNLYHYLSAEDISILLENYSDVVKYLMFSSRPNIVTSNGWCDLSIEIPQLCQALAECKEGSRVLLPYAGDGTIAACLPAGCDVYGFEENRELWATANIYMDAIGIKSNLQLEENVDNNQQYDYIFCFPPLLKGIEMREIIGRLRDLALHNLTADGEMYCILPKSFCGTINWLDLRKLPLENNGEYSTMVISLPEGLLYPISGIQLCLFHLKRNFVNQVILVNASDESFLSHKVMTNGNSRETVGVSLKVNSILETIDSRDADYVWSGDIIRLFEMSHDLDMTPSRYISVIKDVQLAPDERMVSLKELIEILPIKRIPNAPKEIPSIGARELYSNYIYCDIPYDKISVEGKSSSRFNTRIITQDCLLMCFVGGKFKVARLKGVSESHPVALAQWIIPFVISSTSVDEDFLLRCITSAFVEKQAKALVKGTYIKTIRIDDYGNLFTRRVIISNFWHTVMPFPS